MLKSCKTFDILKLLFIGERVPINRQIDETVSYISHCSMCVHVCFDYSLQSYLQLQLLVKSVQR
jgi:hypothetical protein